MPSSLPLETRKSPNGIHPKASINIRYFHITEVIDAEPFGLGEHQGRPRFPPLLPLVVRRKALGSLRSIPKGYYKHNATFIPAPKMATRSIFFFIDGFAVNTIFYVVWFNSKINPWMSSMTSVYPNSRCWCAHSRMWWMRPIPWSNSGF